MSARNIVGRGYKARRFTYVSLRLRLTLALAIPQAAARLRSK
jgi:hypothetical protein